jgi:FAD/FMN-containing dehydrogenase
VHSVEWWLANRADELITCSHAMRAEVAEVIRCAAADGVPVTPAGGQTSTTGASISDRGVVLSLRALDRILDIDTARRTARVQAGAGLGDGRTALR